MKMRYRPAMLSIESLQAFWFRHGVTVNLVGAHGLVCIAFAVLPRGGNNFKQTGVRN